MAFPFSPPRPQKPRAADVLESADAFIWHPNGRLSPSLRVNRVYLWPAQRQSTRMPTFFLLRKSTELFANGFILPTR